MGAKIFRDDSWSRIRAGIVSGPDILHLDPEKDRHLVSWILLHMEEEKRERAMKKCHIPKLFPKQVNTDDPEDTLYPLYFILLEQVMREEDKNVLKEAAFRNGRDSIGRFAFCRLTGYSYPPDLCDACSYRTYECGQADGMTGEEVEAFCREMIEKKGPFAGEAQEVLRQIAGRPDREENGILSDV